MTRYQELVDLFRVLGIDNEEKLEEALKHDPGFHTVVVLGKSSPETLGSKVAKAIQNIDLSGSSEYQDWGIQQYSLCDKPHVLEEDIKKGLFLSRRSTIFTAHKFYSESRHDDYVGDSPIYNIEETIYYDREFVRDLYLYREPIRRGELRLMPAKFMRSHSETVEGREPYYSSETKNLLNEINRTNVLKVDPRPGTIRKVLSRFARNEQMVHLPSLRVPWVSDLDVDDILRIKTDEKLSIDKFQVAYHEALAEHIKNYGSLNFARISEQIQEDIIQPRLDDLERRYRRVVTMHRKLATAGAALAFLPLAITIISAKFFQTELIQPLSVITPLLTGSVASYAINKIQVENKKGELEDTDFYVLWRLQREG